MVPELLGEKIRGTFTFRP